MPCSRSSDGTLLVGGFKQIPVSVFERRSGDWTSTTTLTSSTYTGPLALSGDVAVIGMPADRTLAYVYERADGTWTRRARLRPEGGTQDTRLVWAVATDGTTAVIGNAPKGPLADTGNAYVFERTGGSWHRRRILTSGTPVDDFGESVGVSNDALLVGDDAHGTVYVYSREDGQWSRRKPYSATGGGSIMSFGKSVDVTGHSAVVGAPDYGPSGAAFELEVARSEGPRRGSYYSQDSAKALGNDVAISGTTAVVADAAGTNAFVYGV